MRYIGNKTKLLPFIGSLLDRLNIPPGRSLDAFAGTAAVGRLLKARGSAVVGCDLMTFSYVLQRAYVVADAYSSMAGLADDPAFQAARRRSDFGHRVDRRVTARHTKAVSLQRSVSDRSMALCEPRVVDEALVYLDAYLDPLTSFVSRHFAASRDDQHDDIRRDDATPRDGDGSRGARRVRAPSAIGVRDLAPQTRADVDVALAPAGVTAEQSGHPRANRMYFTLECARRIDAIRHQLHDWRSASMIDDDGFFLLLAALVEAADAVANTAGVYAAYIKSWQSNALRELRLRLPALVSRSPLAGACAAHLGDVSALAPELGHFDLLYLDPPYNTRQYSAYYHVPEIIARGWFDGEPDLRGKTGLLPDAKKSAWSTRAGCVSALERLLAETDADHVVLSYNSEGIIPETDIVRLFREHGRRETYCRVTRMYSRYRSDRPSVTRNYKADSVREYLYYVRKGR